MHHSRSAAACRGQHGGQHRASAVGDRHTAHPSRRPHDELEAAAFEPPFDLHHFEEKPLVKPVPGSQGRARGPDGRSAPRDRSDAGQCKKRGRASMRKITAEDLQRNACVYIRKSTPDQLMHNPENQRRQCRLADRAKHSSKSSTTISDDRGAALPARLRATVGPNSALLASLRSIWASPLLRLGASEVAKQCKSGCATRTSKRGV